MRTEKHNGRKNKNGNAYSPKHNDRNFDPAKTNVKHPELTETNIYLNMYEHGPYLDKDKAGHMTFEEAEKRFYAETFSEGAAVKQAEDIKQRHPERQAKHTPEYWRTSTRTCPEDTVYQIGRPGDGETIEGKPLWNLVMKQLKWEAETFPQVKVIDVAMHRDETTEHFHVRKVYVNDSNGYALPNEAGVLRQLGFKDRYIDENGNDWKTFDDKGKPIGATEETGKPYKVSAKAQYTAKCRAHWEEMVKQKSEELGLHFTTERLEKGKTGRDMDEVRTERQREELSAIKKKTAEEKKAGKEAKEARKSEEAETERLRQENAQLSLSLRTAQTQLSSLKKQEEKERAEADRMKKVAAGLYKSVSEIVKKIAPLFSWAKTYGMRGFLSPEDRKLEESLPGILKALEGMKKQVSSLIDARESAMCEEEERGEEEDRRLW